ncbi:hypothetical protein ACHHYP_05494 [Achlya hypogyna]|uniref:Homeobox domain-containing protein n=1 Tax=Achlya hypogyna TaxID=1202772 RepID=A0A1V9YY41_ACHHY|nr:hypothetical protein ACHHYP_05494 [Achlya hypogyna]
MESPPPPSPPPMDESQTQMPLDMMLPLQMPLEMAQAMSDADDASAANNTNTEAMLELATEPSDAPVLLDTVLPEAPLGPDVDFAHVLHTNDLIDYSSSSHIRRRGAEVRLVPVARYFPLVPPPSYQPPGNAAKSIHQQVALRIAFMRNNRPTKDELLELSAHTGLPWLEIATWFKGERWRLRRTGGIVATEGGRPTPKAWALIMEGIPEETPPTAATAMQKTIATRAKEKTMLRKSLSKRQVDRSVEWAAQLGETLDPKEREFRIGALVDQLDFRGRQEFRKVVLAEPSLGLCNNTSFKTRKSCADATCSREVVTARADQAWAFMESRFGAANHESQEKYVDDEGKVLLDASLLAGMECMFLRHRDYFMALVHRLKVAGTWS